MTTNPEMNPDAGEVPVEAQVLPPVLQGALPLLLSVPASFTPGDTSQVKSVLEMGGGHIVRRQLAEGETHVYKVICLRPGEVRFRTFFAQPQATNGGSLVVTFVTGNNGNFDSEENTGSSVAHGDFGPLEFKLTNGQPDHYFLIDSIVGQPVPDAPYVFAVAIV